MTFVQNPLERFGEYKSDEITCNTIIFTRVSPDARAHPPYVLTHYNYILRGAIYSCVASF